MSRSLLKLIGVLLVPGLASGQTDFREHVAPILREHCIRCHKGTEPEGGLNLTTHKGLRAGGDSGPAIVPRHPDRSLLIDAVSGTAPDMPANAPPLAAHRVKTLRAWIEAGAEWPDGLVIAPDPADWWSLRPLHSPTIPEHPRSVSTIDALMSQEAAPPASRRHLIRRLTYDLIGLPPSWDEVQEFVADDRPNAYARLVERLLASPHYGERWARHWLDLVHYGDTHGYDKDKLRPNAWPYRDYVIRAFNEDRNYARFVREQLAGDVLWPETRDGIEATGFIAAGPWDFIGHAEVPETKIDGKVARHLDRDDMVRTTMETFVSTTVGCAQCHDHKFDPVSMRDYYRLQAVFASLDRADRSYDVDPQTAVTRRRLTAERTKLESALEELKRAQRKRAGPELQRLDARIQTLSKDSARRVRPEFGYHSGIESAADATKWVQVDLGSVYPIRAVMLVAAHDDFNNIGAGFGFPLRFRIEGSRSADLSDPVLIADHSEADYQNPGTRPQVFRAKRQVRHVRVTAAKLAPRLPDDFVFALGELRVIDTSGRNVALDRPVVAKDSIEALPRWGRVNLTDGLSRDGAQHAEMKVLRKQHEQLMRRAATPESDAETDRLTAAIGDRKRQLAKLPAQGKVYCGCVHKGSGSFVGRAGRGPREIFVLNRGQVTQPTKRVRPGTLKVIPGASASFPQPTKDNEGHYRVALADWITRVDNPLTWRSIVNRVWLWHFGTGLVSTPNDFGRMGQKPTNPVLLDYLATRFREHQSLKQLHREIVMSRTYRADSARPGTYVRARKLQAEQVRDALLLLAGRLNRKMGGPGFRDFVLERPEHSPHFEYDKHDPDDVSTHRRSIYRFIVRSQPQPFMDTLNCADPSQLVPQRHNAQSALQALTLMNNPFVLRMCEHMAKRFAADHETPRARVRQIVREALGRNPTDSEIDALEKYTLQHGVANTCRVVLNMNEFSYVD